MGREKEQLPSSPAHGMENLEDEEEPLKAMIPMNNPSGSKTDQLTTLVFVSSTLLLALSVYVSFVSFIYVLDWFSDGPNDKFRWGRMFQTVLGLLFALVSSHGIQSSYAATPAARQIRIAKTFTTGILILLGMQALLSIATIAWVACDGMKGLKHPSVGSTLSTFASVGSLGTVLLCSSWLRTKELRNSNVLPE